MIKWHGYEMTHQMIIMRDFFRGKNIVFPECFGDIVLDDDFREEILGEF